MMKHPEPFCWADRKPQTQAEIDRTAQKIINEVFDGRLPDYLTRKTEEQEPAIESCGLPGEALLENGKRMRHKFVSFDLFWVDQ